MMPFSKRLPAARGIVLVIAVAASILVAGDLRGQTVPVAEGAIGDEWPTIAEMGVPLYPDLAAYYRGDNPGPGPNPQGYKFVNFASQETVATLLAWYQDHVDGWVVNASMEMIFPEGAGVTEAMAGSTPFVTIAEMEDGCLGVACSTMVQVVYQPQ